MYLKQDITKACHLCFLPCHAIFLFQSDRQWVRMSFCSWTKGEIHKDNFSPGNYNCSECDYPLFSRYWLNRLSLIIWLSCDIMSYREVHNTSFENLNHNSTIWHLGSCVTRLYFSEQKYKHHTPWPAFKNPVHPDSLSKVAPPGPLQNLITTVLPSCLKILAVLLVSMSHYA